RHPRWIGQVLWDESTLVYPDEAWRELGLEPIDERLLVPSADVPQFAGGVDRSNDIVPDDFFDAAWTLGDDEPGDGVHALVQLGDLAMVCAPDLYSPRPLPSIEQILDPPTLAGPEFACCVDPVAKEQVTAPPELLGLM